MKIKQLVRIFYHLVAFTIFLIEAQHSLNKYFNYPIIIQESWIKADSIEKPFVQVCFPNYFDYRKAFENGYLKRSRFLSGGIPSSSKPTWIGVNGNVTFQDIIQEIYKGDFSKVALNQKYKRRFIQNKGFCLEVKNLAEHLRITTTDQRLRVFLIHNSTDIRVFSNNDQLEFGLTSNISADFKVFELNYEIHDNTVYEGRTCFDYRKQKETGSSLLNEIYTTLTFEM